jgi:hypothetical protein
MNDKIEAGVTMGDSDRLPIASSESAPDGKTGASPASALFVFTATTFLSALLLFSVQPMFAKMVLPILGGAPSVWAVAMVFFQATLLAGYCYAHVLIRSVPPKAGGIIHLGLSAAAILALPIGVPEALGEPPAEDPALWQLGLFAAGVGLPFLAVSANAPLLQAWFASSGHRHAHDPYFLYGASNLGSLIALLSYPLVLEPAFGVSALSKMWAAGFVTLVAFILLSVMSIRGTNGAAENQIDARETDRTPPTLGRRLAWIGLAFVPSALLTAFTTHITMDVASAPLLWVMPLALYLLTFVLVFREKPIALLPAAVVVALGSAAIAPFLGTRILGIDVTTTGQVVSGITAAVAFMVAVASVFRISSMAGMRAVHIVALILALLSLSQTEHEGWFVTATTGVAVFFAATMVAHRTLYELRPSAHGLTEFYLLMSLGGVLGGLFAALLAPRIFSQIFEYPLLLAMSVACRPGAVSLSFSRERRDDLLSLWLVVAGTILALVWLPQVIADLPAIDATNLPGPAWWMRSIVDVYMALRLATLEWGTTATLAFVFAAAMLILWRHPSRQFVVALGMCAAIVLLPSGVRRADAERSYFGVYRVYPSGKFNILTHGTTLHGAQRMRDDTGAPAPDPTPGTYYYPDSPMARSVKTVRSHVAPGPDGHRFGIVGLGSGSLACLAEKGERWRFYEIDPLMVRIASNPENFTYLESCQPKPPDIVVGDARLTLAREPDGSFDLIIVDAFTSDAVPIHLMTAEALRLYLAKTSPDGVAVLHISNRYLDLDAVLAATVGLVDGAQGLLVSDDEADGSYAQTTSTIAVFGKSAEALAPFRALPGVKELDAKGLRPWTDDYSDIIGPFRSKMNQ